MRIYMILVLLFSSSFAQAKIIVTFSGKLDRTYTDINSINPNPYSVGDSYFASFELDEVVAAQNGVFEGAFNNFKLNLAGSIFSGNNGKLAQYLNAGDAGPASVAYIAERFGEGTATGSAPDGTPLIQIEVDIYNLVVPDPNVIVPAPLVLKSSYGLSYGFSLAFSNGSLNSFFTVDSSNSSIVQFNYDEASPVPLPATVWLFTSGLIGLLGFSKKRSFK